ncbi:MAG: hypothetical protein KJO73_07690 [Croceitalea sp.]|nr:hypothetical protein [Croceitalea sp.]MBT8237935.1 hypothetical protein [Croceitalea sp.]
MKALILSLLACFTMATYGQFKKVDSYTTSTGKTIVTGDTFELGAGSGENETYLYITMKPSIASAAAYKMKKGLAGKKYKVELIRKLKNPIGGLSGATIIFKIGTTRYLIDLENALRTKEVVLY